MLVVSATPQEALQREWDEHDLSRFVVAICGQEVGTKKQCMGAAAKYPASHSLMIGDAPGDHAAATANHALFFPINPGGEEHSWKRFFEEGIDRFFAGAFAGAYQQELLDEFDSYLPDRPSWPLVDRSPSPTRERAGVRGIGRVQNLEQGYVRDSTAHYKLWFQNAIRNQS